MDTQILTSKITAPFFASELMIRTDLIDLIKSGLSRKLTLVSAPAGYGKTCAVYQSLSVVKFKSFWLTLEESENNLTSFLRYLIAAVKPTETAIGKTAWVMQNSINTVNSEELLVNLLNDFAAQTEDIAIVLDDIHKIYNPEVFSAVEFLLNHLPPHVHLIIISRIDPPISYSRLRSQGQFSRISTENLCFTPDEFKQVLQLQFPLFLSENQQQLIFQRTEGWPAGIQLASIVLHDNANVNQFLEGLSGTQEYIADYFVDEVLKTLDPKIKEYLLQISVLKVACVELCDAIFGGQVSLPMIQTLFQNQLFIRYLDSEKHWFQIHPLFRELLYHRLQLEAPTQVESLQQRAIRWYRLQDRKRETIEIAIEANLPTLAIEVISDYADILWASGEQTLLVYWFHKIDTILNLKRLPDNFLYHFIRVLILTGQIDEAKKYLALVNEKEDAEAEKRDVLTATLQFYQGNVSGAVQTLGSLAGSPLYEKTSLWQIFYHNLLGICLSWLGELEKGSTAIYRAYRSGQQLNQPFFVLNSGFRLASNYLQMGQLNSSASICEECLSLAEENNLENLVQIGGFYAIQSSIFSEQGHLSEANKLAFIAVRHVSDSHDLAIVGYSTITLMRSLLLQENYEQLIEAITVLEKKIQNKKAPKWLMGSILRYRVLYYLASHQNQIAKQVLSENGLFDGTAPDLTEFDEYLSIATYYLVEGKRAQDQKKFQAGLKLSYQLWKLIEKRELPLKHIQIIQLQRLYFRFLKMDRDYVKAEKQLLKLSVKLKNPASVKIEENLLLNLIKQNLNDSSIHQPKVTSITPMHSLKKEHTIIEPLTIRELEVLRILNSSLNTSEIAESFGVAPSTIRTHIKNIYQKLDVHNRLEALEQARRNGLI